MFKVNFYQTRKGKQPVKDFLVRLNSEAETSKSSRIRLKKIYEYIGVLANNGTRAGEKFTKHISGNLWELRPLSDRIFFFFWHENTFVLLHHFLKKTQKTPKKEIEQAIRNMLDFIERTKGNEEK